MKVGQIREIPKIMWINERKDEKEAFNKLKISTVQPISD